MDIDAVVYFHVTDPYKATYKVQNYMTAMTYLIQTTLRNQIARMDMEGALSNKEEINEHLGQALDQATDEWGVKVERVEIKDMTPPPDIQQAMEKQMKAERERREEILRAQGKKEASLTESEGKKRSAILEAEGRSESAILDAEAEKETARLRAESKRETAKLEAEATEIQARAEARKVALMLKAMKESDLDEKVLTMKHIEALMAMAQGDNKVFIPYNAQEISNLGMKLDMLNEKETKQ